MSDFSTTTPDPGNEPEVDFDSLGSEYDELLGTEDEIIQLPKSKLQKYANEHASYRKKYGPLKEAWGDAPDDDVRALSAFYGALRSGDPVQIKAAADWMNGVISDLSPAEQKVVNKEIKDIAKETGQTQAEVKAALTPEDIERMVEEKASKLMDERERKRQEEAAVNENVRKMQDLGKELAEQYNVPAWANPEHRLYGMLMQATSQVLAQESGLTVFDAMKKAADVVLEDLQGVTAAQLSKKKATAGAGAKATPKVGAEPVGQGPAQSFESARARAMARLNAQPGI